MLIGSLEGAAMHSEVIEHGDKTLTANRRIRTHSLDLRAQTRG